jgi:hypothetical protein
MKRNFDLVREILLAAEAQDFHRTQPIAPVGYSNEEIKYHIKIMVDGGLLQMKQHPKIDVPAPVFDGLTWEGHEFLDSIREKSTWESVKNTLKDKGLALSYEALKSVVVVSVKSVLAG